MKCAVIYARYSSESQTEQSIEGQIRVCKEFAERNDMVIVDTYIDRAMTGTNDNRYDFQRMLKDSNKKQFQIVLVYKLDRFARNQYESVTNRKKLENNGVSLVSAMENIPDTPEGKLFRSIIEGYNEYYSEDVRQKVKRGLFESWEKGQFSGGHILYGFSVENMKVIVNDYEAFAVKTIFTMYAKGYAAPYIAKTLTEQGYRRKDGTKIKSDFIYRCIANVKYTGRVFYGGKWYENIYPRIIDEDLWARVQAIRESNKHSPSRRKEKQGFILTGKLICGDCHRLMVGESGTSQTGALHYYYSCITQRRGRGKCDMHSVNKVPLEDIVINTTWKLLTQKISLDKIAESLYNLHQKETSHNVNIKALERKKADAEKSCANLIKALEQGFLTEQTKTRLRELETEIQNYETELSRERQKTYATLTVDMIKDYLLSFVKGKMDNLDVRKLIVNNLIREIILQEDEIIITYNFTKDFDGHKISKESTEDIIRQSQKAAKSSQNSSYLLMSSPPMRCTNRLWKRQKPTSFCAPRESKWRTNTSKLISKKSVAFNFTIQAKKFFKKICEKPLTNFQSVV